MQLTVHVPAHLYTYMSVSLFTRKMWITYELYYTRMSLSLGSDITTTVYTLLVNLIMILRTDNEHYWYFNCG